MKQWSFKGACRNSWILCLWVFAWGTMGPDKGVLAHTIHYTVEPKGITIRVFYAAEDPANYAEYEVFGPGDTDPYQVGRTDRRGCLSLLPDRPGDWKVKVLGESAHGFHGITIDFKVDQAMSLETFSKPLVATHTRLVTGLSLIIGLFGIYAWWRSRRKSEPGGPPRPQGRSER